MPQRRRGARTDRGGPPVAVSPTPTARRPRRPATTAVRPTGPVPIDTGTVELVDEPDRPGAVTVLVNGVPSSHLVLDDPTWLEFEYMQQMAALIHTLRDGPLDALHLGAGACSMPRWVEATRPGSRQTAVDLDGALLTLVREWFALPRSPRLRLRVGEAREVLTSRPTASADLIVRDVFAPDVTPDHLVTVELAEQVARVLRPEGLYLANCADRPPLSLARSEVATARAVFADVALVAEPGQLRGRRYGNLVLAATVSEHGPDLGAPGPARALRSLPVPARLLHGAELDEFVGTTPPRHDPPAAPDGH